MDYINENKRSIFTAKDFHLAKSGFNKNIEKMSEDDKKIKIDPKLWESLHPNNNFINVYDGEKIFTFSLTDETMLQNMLSYAKRDKHYKRFLPKYECNGEGTCGTCGMNIVKYPEQGNLVKTTKKEKQLLNVNGFTNDSILICQHKCKELGGYVFMISEKK